MVFIVLNIVNQEIMKIVHVINNFSHTSIPVEMAQLMSKSNLVDVVSLYDSQTKAEQMASLYAIDCRNIYGCGFKNNPIKAIVQLKHVLCNGCYDIIQTHHTLSGALSSFFMYNKTRSRVVTTIHGNSHSYSFRQNMITSYIVRNVNGVVYNSKTTKDGMLGWQKRCIKKDSYQQVIYNGININRITNVNRDFGNIFCLNYGLPEDAFLIVQIGRLEKVKNPYASLYAFEKYLETYLNEKNVYLVFVGDGSQRKELKEYVDNHRLLKERVVFTGAISRDEVYSFMHRLNLQIIPSLYEGFCNALFESLTLGNKIMLSKIPVFEELVKGLCGITWFMPYDYIDIAKCMDISINAILTDDQRKQSINFVKNSFDTSSCVENYIKFYNKVSKQRRDNNMY